METKLESFPFVNASELETLKKDMFNAFQELVTLKDKYSAGMPMEAYQKLVLRIEEVYAVAKNIEAKASLRAF